MKLNIPIFLDIIFRHKKENVQVSENTLVLTLFENFIDIYESECNGKVNYIKIDLDLAGKIKSGKHKLTKNKKCLSSLKNYITLVDGFEKTFEDLFKYVEKEKAADSLEKAIRNDDIEEADKKELIRISEGKPAVFLANVFVFTIKYGTHDIPADRNDYIGLLNDAFPNKSFEVTRKVTGLGESYVEIQYPLFPPKLPSITYKKKLAKKDWEKSKNHWKNKKNSLIYWLIAPILTAVLLLLLTQSSNEWPSAIHTQYLIWGPERDLFKGNERSNKVTFNSLKNSEKYGNETNFILAKNADPKANDSLKNIIKLEENGEYFISLYVNNNAKESLRLTAENTTAQFYISDYITKESVVYGFLDASNADPNRIFNSMVFKSDSNFRLSYIKGSALLINETWSKGVSLSDRIVTSKYPDNNNILEGAILGYTDLDGSIPGGEKYSGWVSIRVKAEFNDFTLENTVRKKGDKEWKKEIPAEYGDEIEYQVYFNNTSPETLKDVIIDFNLPKSIEIIQDSVCMKTINGNSNITTSIVGRGLNIGGYTSGSNAYIKFTVKVLDSSDIPDDGYLTSIVTATTTIGKKSDSNDVKINVK